MSQLAELDTAPDSPVTAIEDDQDVALLHLAGQLVSLPALVKGTELRGQLPDLCGGMCRAAEDEGQENDASLHVAW